MTDAVTALAARIAALEAADRRRGDQLAYSSIEDGAIREFSLEGVQTGQYGLQHDGTSTAATLVSPEPPIPTPPTAQGADGGLVVAWDGMYVDPETGATNPLLVAPMDWARVDVVVTNPGGDPLGTPPLATIGSPRGGAAIIQMPEGDYVAWLITRTLAGRASTPSTGIDVTALPSAAAAAAQALATAEEAEQAAAAAVDAAGVASTNAGNALAAANQAGADADGALSAANQAQADATAAGQAASAASAAAGEVDAMVDSWTATDQVSIDGGKLFADSVLAASIGASQVTAVKIAADAVTAAKILAGNVTAVKIATDAITAAKIQAGAVEADKIAANAVTAVKILAGAVTTDKIEANAVTAAKIAAGTITAGSAIVASLDASKITTGSMNAARIAAGTITAIQMATRSITAEKLLLGSPANLAPNGTGEFGQPGGWLANAAIVLDTTDKPADISGAHRCAAGTGSVGTPGPAEVGWDCKPGEEFLVEVWLKADKPDSRIYLEIRDQDGNHGTTSYTIPGETGSSDASSYPITNQPVPTAWTRYAMRSVAGAGAKRLRMGTVYFNHNNGTERNAVQSVAVRVRRRTGAELIVDGAITARTLAADAIDGKTITGAHIIGPKIETATSGPSIRLEAAPTLDGGPTPGALVFDVDPTVDPATQVPAFVRAHNANSFYGQDDSIRRLRLSTGWVGQGFPAVIDIESSPSNSATFKRRTIFLGAEDVLAIDMHPKRSNYRGSSTAIPGSGTLDFTGGPGIAFVAPASGRVKVYPDIYLRGSSGGAFGYVVLRNGATLFSGSEVEAIIGLINHNTDWIRAGAMVIFENLTPGNSYNLMLRGTGSGFMSSSRITVEPSM